MIGGRFVGDLEGVGDTTRQASHDDSSMVGTAVPVPHVTHTGPHLHGIPWSDVPTTIRALRRGRRHELALLPVVLVGPLREVGVEVPRSHWRERTAWTPLTPQD